MKRTTEVIHLVTAVVFLIDALVRAGLLGAG